MSPVANMNRIGDGDVMLLQREIGQIPFVVDTARKIDLKLQPNMLKHIMLHLRWKFTTATLAIDVPEGMYPIIQKLEVRTSNGLILKSIRGTQLHYFNNYEFFTIERDTIPNDIGSLTLAGETDLLIPFEDHTGLLPERTVLNTNEFNELTLTIWWGDMNNVSAEWVPAADTLNYLYCDVVTLERERLTREDELLSRQRMVDTFQQQAAQAENIFLLPENTMLKTLMLITRDGDKARNDGVIGRVRVDYDSGNVVIREYAGTAVQSLNKQYYHVEQVATGVYIIEFDYNRDFTSLFTTIGRNYARLITTEPDVPVDNATIELIRRVIATPTRVTP